MADSPVTGIVGGGLAGAVRCSAVPRTPRVFSASLDGHFCLIVNGEKVPSAMRWGRGKVLG